MSDLIIGRKITKIGAYSLSTSDNAVTRVMIPKNIKVIDPDTFKMCDKLQRIDCEFGKDSIKGAPWGAPAGCKINYDVLYTGKMEEDDSDNTGIDTSDATATASDILQDKTAYAKDEKITGTIPTVTASISDNVVTVPKGYVKSVQTLTVAEAAAPTVSDNVVTVPKGYNKQQKQVTVGNALNAYTITPGTASQVISKGSYLKGEVTVSGDSNLTSANIKSGVDIFGVSGTLEEGENTSDATATAANIVSGKTAYIASGKVTGTLKAAEIAYNSANYQYYAVSDGYLNAGDMVLDFATATFASATTSNILIDRTAYVNGKLVTGSMEIYRGSFDITPGVSGQTLETAYKYVPDNIYIRGDSNLVAENIKSGVSIFNVTGTYEGESSGGTSAAYYKCASVSSGDGEIKLVVSGSGWGSSVDGIYTLETPGTTGQDRVWIYSGDGFTTKLYFDSYWKFWDAESDDVIFYDENMNEDYDFTNPEDVHGWYGYGDNYTPVFTYEESGGSNTWSGYKAVFDSGTGTWSFESDVTEGLAYTSVTPIVGGIYSADALVIVSLLYTGTPTLTSPTGMTSESSDEWEISASDNYGAYYPWKAFDGITDPMTNCWTGNSGSSWWLQWQNKQKQVLVQRLKMTVADSLSQQAVLSFTLQGSDDGNTWTDIHSESGLSWTTNGESKEFTFANSKSYYYHRLVDITAPSFPTILELETYDM